MGIAIITGIQDSSKDAIMEVLLEDKTIPPFEYINMEHAEYKKDIKMFLKEFNRETKESVIDALKKGKTNIIINIPLTIETEKGFIPVLSDDFFDYVKPDSLIVIEDKPDVRIAKEKKKKMEMQQHINMEYAVRYSSYSGCPLKIIKTMPGNIKDSIKEIKKIIKSIFG